MFLSDWRVLSRRWYIVLVGLSLTAMLCVAVTAVVPPKYQVTSSVLFLPPHSDTVAQGGNPFLALGGLETIAGVVARTVSDSAVQARVKAAGGTGEYTVEPDAKAGGPVLLVTVEDRTPARALRTLAVVLKQLPRTLSTLQTTAGVAEPSLITSKEITREDRAQAARPGDDRGHGVRAGRHGPRGGSVRRPGPPQGPQARGDAAGTGIRWDRPAGRRAAEAAVRGSRHGVARTRRQGCETGIGSSGPAETAPGDRGGDGRHRGVRQAQLHRRTPSGRAGRQPAGRAGVARATRAMDTGTVGHALQSRAS